MMFNLFEKRNKTSNNLKLSFRNLRLLIDQKMSIMKNIGIILFRFFVVLEPAAQDIHFSQYYAAPLNLNTAMLLKCLKSK